MVRREILLATVCALCGCGPGGDDAGPGATAAAPDAGTGPQDLVGDGNADDCETALVQAASTTTPSGLLQRVWLNSSAVSAAGVGLCVLVTLEPPSGSHTVTEADRAALDAAALSIETDARLFSVSLTQSAASTSATSLNAADRWEARGEISLERFRLYSPHANAAQETRTDLVLRGPSGGAPLVDEALAITVAIDHGSDAGPGDAIDVTLAGTQDGFEAAVLDGDDDFRIAAVGDDDTLVVLAPPGVSVDDAIETLLAWDVVETASPSSSD